MSTAHNIYLHGILDITGGEPISMVGSTVAEIIEGCGAQIATLHRPQVVAVVGCDTEADLYRPLEEGEEVHIFPVLEGDRGSLTQILLGGVLIALGMGPLAGSMLLGVNVGTMAVKLGALMLLGGINALLSPTPEADKNNSSKYLGAPKNTVQIGTRIPVLYGEYRVAGHYLSFDINSGRQEV